MSQDGLQRKKAFFDFLEAFTGEQDSDEDFEEELYDCMTMPESHIATEQAFVQERASTSAQLSSNPSQRCSSASPVEKHQDSTNLTKRCDNLTVQRSDQAEEQAVDAVEVTKSTPLAFPSAQIDAHAGQSSSKISNTRLATTSKAAGKRKRGPASPQIPECRKIFNGLQFYFFPDNKIAAPRRKRIEKAIEYGAEWVEEWRPSVISHVIADKSLTYADLIKYLKIPKLPIGIIIVNEDYPADCIDWGHLVDPTLRSYQVKGYRDAQNSENAQQIISKPPKDQLEKGQQSLQEPRIAGNTVLNAVSIAEPSAPRSFQEVTSEESSASGGILQEAIACAQATAHLPLDSDDEDQSEPGFSSSTGSLFVGKRNMNLEPVQEKRRSDPSGDIPDWQNNFQCMKAHSSNAEAPSNPNMQIIKILQEMLNYYSSAQDQWRTRAYRLAIGTLRKETRPITTKEEAQNLKFIGPRLAAKIEEIYWTNKLQQLENAKLGPVDEIWQTFINVYGAGFSQASKWIQEGHRTLQDLLSNANLTSSQRIGVEHYADFLRRIPRSEVAQHGAIVQAALYKIDPNFETIIGGSFRRGAKDSGDVDMIITKKGADGAYLRAVVIDKLVPKLQRQGFLVAGLAVTQRNNGSKWHGACQLPLSTGHAEKKENTNPWRRIDLLLVPYCELGAAKIYFTGNDLFNRSMRLLARKKGMRLNQRGLYKDVLRDGTKKLTEGTKIEGESEERIFKALGVPWREASERNI